MVSRLEKEGNRSSSIAGYVKTLKGWWLFNDLDNQVVSAVYIVDTDDAFDPLQLRPHLGLRAQVVLTKTSALLFIDGVPRADWVDMFGSDDEMPFHLCASGSNSIHYQRHVIVTRTHPPQV